MSQGSDAANFVIPQLRPISLINSRNEAPIRLVPAADTTLEREIKFAGGPFHIYRHPRPGDANT